MASSIHCFRGVCVKGGFSVVHPTKSSNGTLECLKKVGYKETVAIVRELCIYEFVHPYIMHPFAYHLMDDSMIGIQMPAAHNILTRVPKDRLCPLRLYQQIGSALTFLHKKGIMHNDVRPSNIVFTTKDNKPISECTKDEVCYVLIDFTNVFKGATKMLTRLDCTSPSLYETGMPSVKSDMWSLAKSYFQTMYDLPIDYFGIVEFKTGGCQVETFSALVNASIERFICELKPCEDERVMIQLIREQECPFVEVSSEYIANNTPTYGIKVPISQETEQMTPLRSWSTRTRVSPETDSVIAEFLTPHFSKVTPLLIGLIKRLQGVSLETACFLVQTLIRVSTLTVTHFVMEDPSIPEVSLFNALVDIDLDVQSLIDCQECL